MKGQRCAILTIAMSAPVLRLRKRLVSGKSHRPCTHTAEPRGHLKYASMQRECWVLLVLMMAVAQYAVLAYSSA